MSQLVWGCYQHPIPWVGTEDVTQHPAAHRAVLQPRTIQPKCPLRQGWGVGSPHEDPHPDGTGEGISLLNCGSRSNPHDTLLGFPFFGLTTFCCFFFFLISCFRTKPIPSLVTHHGTNYMYFPIKVQRLRGKHIFPFRKTRRKRHKKHFFWAFLVAWQ